MIELVQQPTDNTCSSACLSMLTGIPVNVVVSEYHDIARLSGSTMNPWVYLQSKGIESRYVPTYSQVLWYGRTYLLAVPSLNVPGILHHIVLTPNQDHDIRVLDPNFGRHGKKYYIWEESEDPLEFKLQSWHAELEILT